MTRDEIVATLQDLGTGLSRHAPVIAIVVALAGAATVAAGWRRHRRALADRESRIMLPTDSFDPSLEEIARYWGQALAATRRRSEWHRRKAEAIRFCLSATDGGSVTLRLEASHRALALLEPAVPHQCELERPEPQAEDATDDQEVSEREGRRRSRRPSLRRTSSFGAKPRVAGVPADAGAAGVVPPASTIALPTSPQLNPPELVAHDPTSKDHGPWTMDRPESGIRNPVRARAELTITPGQTHALAQLALSPDPLTPLAAALADLAEGEGGWLALDLMPLSGGQRKAARRRARRRDSARPDWTRQFTSGTWLTQSPLEQSRPPASAPASGALKRLEARSETMTDYDRFASGEPVFAAQLLVWADAPTRARAREIVNMIVAGLSPMHQRASWRRAGVQVWRWRIGGADASSNRWRFDHRAAGGCHHPRKASIVGSAEVAGLLKPPTMHCHVSNVRRGGGLVPPPPIGLPTWEPGVEGILPLGEVTERGVKRWVGVYLADTFFQALFGKSRFGKTMAALVMMVALSRLAGVPGGRGSQLAGGFAFLDPHGDGIDDLKRYLVPVADRVQIMDLRRRPDTRQAGWNPLSMVGRDPDEIEDTVSMMVAGFSAVLGWSEVNNRAQNLLTQSVSSLCQLNLRLPPHLQATLFQIPTILVDDPWREEILRFLPAHLRDFWTTKLKTQTDAKTATSPVTNLCDRLRASGQMSALFGQSVSTFDMRKIMDTGTILLLCPGGAGDKEQMAHVLLLFEMFRAATSRHDTDPGERRRFDAFLDEMQVADQGSGSNYITRMFREAAKFGLRIAALAQQPDALSPQTLAAIADNRSHLSSTTVGHRSATWLAAEFGKAVEPSTMTRIPKYHRIASVTLGGAPSPPFRIRNLSLVEAFGPPASDDEVAALEATVDRNMGRQSAAEVQDHLSTLDGRILDHLRGGRPAPPVPTPPRSGGRVRREKVTAGADELPAGVASIDKARSAHSARGPWKAG